MIAKYHKLALTASIILAMAFIFSCSSSGDDDNSTNGSFTDGRDGNVYKIVKIGEQTWMAQNLNYEVPADDTDTSACYEYDTDHCAKYGRLYNWAVAKTACPGGWRLPSSSDWNKLLHYVDTQNSGEAGKYLKAKSGWNPKTEGGSGDGEDKYGFEALPGGYRLSSGKGGGFDNVGNYGIWWSSSIDNSAEYDQAYYIFMDYNQEGAYLDTEEPDAMFSVRCLK